MGPVTRRPVVANPWQQSDRRLCRRLAFAVIFGLSFIATPAAQAQSFVTLYTFTGLSDGGNPYGSLIRDAKGNLYGTTYAGGDLSCFAPYGCGTVFRLRGHKETVIHRFTGGPGDGAAPSAGLIVDKAGSLFGTTTYGGRTGCSFNIGCGTAFKIDLTGKETVLYSFTGGADGGNPVAGLIRDSAGNLFGTTFYAAGSSSGTAFKLNNTGNISVLYTFDSQAYPYASLIRDPRGHLYGATWGDGIYCDCGTVYELHGHKETVLYSFGQFVQDGVMPYGRLIRDAEGNLYGTTEAGGSYFCGNGCGTVFKLDKIGTATYLHTFANDQKDGEAPFAGLIRDQSGNLYGTTAYGGIYGGGTVFKVDKTGKETILHSFTGGADGAQPVAELIEDAAGNLYGTASTGGNPNCNRGAGCGVVFEIKP
jgi:uncharacterized repeat protein (TIGR03803 family)